MKKSLKHLSLILIALALVVITGCEKKGPMQTAGDKVDNAAEKTGEAVKDAVEETGKAVDDAVNQ